MNRWLIAACTFVFACGPTGTNGSGGGNSGGSGGTGGSSGAGSGGAGGSHMNCVQTPTCANGGSVSGKVYAPNGADPISGASIYVPTGSEEFPPGISCDVCNQGFASCTQTFSGPDGSFTLNGIPEGMVEIDIQKGHFRRKLHVNVTCNQTLMLTADQSRLPRNSTEGDIPKIAVANGEWDKLECVLRKIGLDASAIDIYNHSQSFNEPGKPDFSALVQDFNMLKSYNIVFINCTDSLLESYLSNTAVLGNLHNYVGMGGRLYITDWSYDHIEQVPEWSNYVCWQGSPSCSGPEPMHAAAIGSGGIEVDATIEDNDLKNWLAQFNVLNANGTAHITHFLVEWVMQKMDMTPPVKEWVKGPVSGSGVNGVLPLTFTFDYNSCGRVLYSSYHTLGRDNDLLTCGLGSCQFPNYCDSNPLSAQERILEYLIFEISTCVAPPG